MNEKVFIVHKVGKACRVCGGKLLKRNDRVPYCRECSVLHLTPLGFDLNRKHGISKDNVINQDMYYLVDDYLKEEEIRRDRMHKAIEEFKSGLV